jgi:hypothetical protein
MSERHPFLGKIVTGRVHSGSVALGDRLKVLWRDGECQLGWVGSAASFGAAFDAAVALLLALFETLCILALPLGSESCAKVHLVGPSCAALPVHSHAGGEQGGFKVTRLMKRHGTTTGASQPSSRRRGAVAGHSAWVAALDARGMPCFWRAQPMPFSSCACCACFAVELERSVAGDIVSIAGVAAAGIADTVAAPEVQQALPPGGWASCLLRLRGCCCCCVAAAVTKCSRH